MNRPRAKRSEQVLLQRVVCVAFLVSALSGCGSVREQFIGTRVEDQCDGEWPICRTTVGCIVGDRSYVEGRFPGQNKLAVQLFEPSTVTLSFYISEVAGTGEETRINFYESECASRIRRVLSGRSLIGESETRGFVSREADLSDVGDHLIEFESDARARYLVKVDVLPLRLKNAGN
jgi:hypothetical protein